MTQPFAAQLQADERLLWHSAPGPTALAPEELASSRRHGLFAAIIASVLASLAGLTGIYLPAVFAGVAVLVTSGHRRGMRLSPTREYAITSTRVLIREDDALRSYGPQDVPYVKVVTMRDGSADVFWGEQKPELGTSSGNARFRARFTPFRRVDRHGFLGLPDAEPAASKLREWRASFAEEAARAALGSAKGLASGAGDSRVAEDTVVSGTEWQTLRESGTGFAIDVPDSWQHRAATVRKTWIFESSSAWGSPATPGWNRLESHPDVAHVGLRVDINPATMPATLEEVLNDKWARVLRLRTVEQYADVSIGALRGFSVLRDMKGVGPSMAIGPVRVGLEASEIAALCRQWWLRGNGRAVYVLVVWPTSVHEMQRVLELAVGSLRFDGRAR